MKTKTTVSRTTVREKILKLLRKVGKPLDAKTIAKKGKLNYNTVRKELGRLWNMGYTEYYFPRTSSKIMLKQYTLLS